MQLFPIALQLQGRRCVVVGGGEVGARKARALLAQHLVGVLFVVGTLVEGFLLLCHVVLCDVFLPTFLHFSFVFRPFICLLFHV